MRGLTALIISFTLITGVAPLGADDWREYRSENIIVYSNIAQENVMEHINDIERMRPYLARVTGLKKTRTPLPVTLYLYRSASDFRKIIGERQMLGVYRPLIKGGVAATVGLDPIDPRKLGGRSIVLHEYVHHYLSQLSPLNYPIWYKEGFADVVSNINYNYGADVRIGEILRPRAEMLNDRSGWAHVNELLNAIGPNIGSKHGWRGHDRFYSQAWLLAHMLTTDTAYLDNTNHFIELLSSGVMPANAVMQSFNMTMSQFNKAYKNHWKSGISLSSLDTTKVVYKAPDISIRKLGPDEERALKWRTQLDFAETPEKIAAIALEIQNSLDKKESVRLRVLYGEALLEFARPDLAGQQIKIAHDLAPNDINVQFMAAKIKLDIAIRRYTGLGPDAVSQEDYNEIQTYLDSVIAAHPNNAEVNYQVGILHFLNPEGDLAGQGLMALKHATALVPQNYEVRLLLAQSQAKLKQYEVACTNAQQVLRYGKSENLRNGALKVIEGPSMTCAA